MPLYTIGGLFDPSKTAWDERSEYRYAAHQHSITLIWNHLTRAEVEAINQGPLQFALFTDDEQIIVFLKLGKASGWLELPYTIHRVHPDGRSVPDLPDPTIHAGITIFLVQAETGRLAAMRFLTISPAMTTALLTAIRHQASTPFDSAYYEARLAGFRRLYPTPDEFVGDATRVSIRCNGGE